MTHECNAYCKNSEHCDMVFTGDAELHIAAPRIAQIMGDDYGVRVIKVQPALQPAAAWLGRTEDKGGWWLTWWVESTPARVA